MSNWSNYKRLGLIKAIVEREFKNPRMLTPTKKCDLLEKIAFLCSMSNEFLEANKKKYQDFLAEGE